MAQTATTSLNAPLPPVNFPWFDSSGRPTQEFAQWAAGVDRVLRAGLLGALISAANDGAAAAAGVPVNGLYRTAGVVHIRLV